MNEEERKKIYELILFTAVFLWLLAFLSIRVFAAETPPTSDNPSIDLQDVHTAIETLNDRIDTLQDTTAVMQEQSDEQNTRLDEYEAEQLKASELLNIIAIQLKTITEFVIAIFICWIVSGAWKIIAGMFYGV